MQIIVRKSDGLVLYSGTGLTLDPHFSSLFLIDQFTTPDNATLVDDVTLPKPYMDYFYTYSNGVFTATNTASPSMQALNAQLATQLLSATDWTEVPSVTDTSHTPHLTNGAAFVTYRVALRAIAVNPPQTVASFPTKPDEAWSS